MLAGTSIGKGHLVASPLDPQANPATAGELVEDVKLQGGHRTSHFFLLLLW